MITLKSDIDMTLTHDGKNWIARNGSVEARGVSLEELDENVKRQMITKGKLKPGNNIVIFMGFDYETIPTWMRQYHTHYFNRYVTFKM